MSDEEDFLQSFTEEKAPQQLRRAAGFVREFFTDRYQPTGVVSVVITDGKVEEILVANQYEIVNQDFEEYEQEEPGAETVNPSVFDPENAV